MSDCLLEKQVNPAEVFSDYPYLGACFIGVPIWAFVIISAGNRRGAALVSGLMLVPLSPLAIFHEGVFWAPNRLFDASFGVEDALYLFLTGSFVIAIAIRYPSFPALRVEVFRRAVVRMVMFSCAAAVFWWTISATLFDPFTAAVLAGLTTVVVLACRRWRVFFPSLVAGFWYCLYHTINVATALALWPDFQQAWSPNAAWYMPVLTVPLGEVVFAAIFGTGHAMVLAMAFEPDDKIVRDPRM